MLRARRLRDEHFPGDLFADPAWDILLDLMAARLERKQVTVSSLCVAAAVPPTTALRWIGVLAERGLLVRAADAADRRRAFVELSDAGARALGGWLRQARRLAAEAL
jgi:DNA-binding MarR family transcriptional regulator